MKLFRVLATINIAAFVKSSSAGYSYVGPGACTDSNGRTYDFTYLPGQFDVDAAYNWCLTAAAYTLKLVGVEVDTNNGYWNCAYDGGSIYNIKVTDFNPAAQSITTSAGSAGSGAVVSSVGIDGITCYKNLVRVESIPIAWYIISYLLSRWTPILSYSGFCSVLSYTDPISCYSFANQRSCYSFANQGSCYAFANQGSCYAFANQSSCYSFANQGSCYAFANQSSCYSFANQSTCYSLSDESSCYSFANQGSCYSFAN
jgi:uncharacterized membrane protein